MFHQIRKQCAFLQLVRNAILPCCVLKSHFTDKICLNYDITQKSSYRQKNQGCPGAMKSSVLQRFQIYITADFMISETALTRSPTAPSRPGVPSLPAGPYNESRLRNELTKS